MVAAVRRRDVLLSLGTGSAAVTLSGFDLKPAKKGLSEKDALVEPRRPLPVTGAYDVVVVGGGIAGVAAAVAAARNGAKTALIEKESALGGLATLANVIVYLPLCDGKGHQVIAALGEELLRLSVRDGYDRVPACWEPGGDPSARRKKRFRVRFNPASFMLELERLVVDTGVDLFYDTRFCDVARDAETVRAIVTESKSGRTAFLCKTVVDASGDADVCTRAGEDVVSLKTNVASAWFYAFHGKELKLVPLSQSFPADPRKEPSDGPGYAGDDVRDVTAQILHSRRLLRARLETMREGADDPGIRPILLPTIASFRMTRRLRGAVELRKADERRFFDDTVGMTGNWRKSGPIYYLPLRCLAGTKSRNLLAAGRCISAVGPCWDITRVIPTCAVTGQAAGVAAARAARTAAGDVSRLDIRALQAALRDQGVIIDASFARE